MKKNVLTSVTVSLAAAAMISGTAMAAEYKVGIIQFVDDASLNQIEQNIEKELTAKSEEGEDTYVFDGYVYNGQADSTTLNQITTQLIDDGVDVIVPIATPAAQIVQAATEDNQIPVVFSAVSDPRRTCRVHGCAGSKYHRYERCIKYKCDSGSDVCSKSGYQEGRTSLQPV